MILVALKGMFVQAEKVPGIFRRSVIDGLLWIISFLAVVLLDIERYAVNLRFFDDYTLY